MSKKIINEIFLLRSVACLSIVLNHAMERSLNNPSELMNAGIMLLTFGTPTFIFISEFILAKSYPDKLPAQFWSKRVKYILMPYFLFGIFYAIAKGFEQALSNGEVVIMAIGHNILRHILLAEYHGYFIIIIFQFYLLHFFFSKYLKKWSPKWVIGLSLMINIVYLGFFNFVDPIPTIVGNYIWSWFYWIPFFGWIFYFTVAYYSGIYFTVFTQVLAKYYKWILAAPLVLAIVSIILFTNGFYPVISSKKIDMVFFTTSMILFIYFVSTKVRTVPKIIIRISQYSFGIYLFHPFFMALISIMLTGPLKGTHFIGEFVVYFVGSIFLSMIATYLINQIPYGYFFIGKIGMGITDKEKESSPNVLTNTTKLT
ncbi:MAG: acyltransferase family protein [Firmicutes bacterium]|nr:acyltransferase family protein [Bacillota bacterium]